MHAHAPHSSPPVPSCPLVQTAGLTASDKCSWICCCPSPWTCFQQISVLLPGGSLSSARHPARPKQGKTRLCGVKGHEKKTWHWVDVPRAMSICDALHSVFAASGGLHITTCLVQKRSFAKQQAPSQTILYIYCINKQQIYYSMSWECWLSFCVRLTVGSCWNQIFLQCKPELRGVMTFAACEKIALEYVYVCVTGRKTMKTAWAWFTY